MKLPKIFYYKKGATQRKLSYGYALTKLKPCLIILLLFYCLASIKISMTIIKLLHAVMHELLKVVIFWIAFLFLNGKIFKQIYLIIIALSMQAQVSWSVMASSAYIEVLCPIHWKICQTAGWPFHPYSLSCLDSPVMRIAWSILVYNLVILLLIKASIVCSIRLTTFDMVKSLISSGRKELERISAGNKVKLVS